MVAGCQPVREEESFRLLPNSRTHLPTCCVSACSLSHLLDVKESEREQHQLFDQSLTMYSSRFPVGLVRMVVLYLLKYGIERNRNFIDGKNGSFLK